MFRRGFKTWCENVAVQQRRQLHLAPTDPIDPYVFAEHLRVEVRMVHDIPGLSSECLRILLHDDSDSWSAVTISTEDQNLVILNSAHARTRLASDLVHELAHLLLGHSPSRIDLTEDGSLMLSTYDRQQEDEANWLAGCLLLPRNALVMIRRQRLDLTLAARQYGTSVDMLKYRINVTGIDYQFKRRRSAQF